MKMIWDYKSSGGMRDFLAGDDFVGSGCMRNGCVEGGSEECGFMWGGCDGGGYAESGDMESGCVGGGFNGGRGFTLIELLVVISIIGVMLGLLMPALGAARRTARASMCLSNIRQLTIAAVNYTASHDGRMPQYLHRLTTKKVKYWFGEENKLYAGPGETNRELDLSGAVLAEYLGGEMCEKITCPEFPYDDDRYFRKFDKEAASYGMNAYVTGAQYSPVEMKGVYVKPYYRIAAFKRVSEIVLFADAVHMDSLGVVGEFSFNDAVYLKIENKNGGFGHFRHGGGGGNGGMCNVSYMDGHGEAEGFEEVERTYEDIAGDAAGNFTNGEFGANTVYGCLDEKSGGWW